MVHGFNTYPSGLQFTIIDPTAGIQVFSAVDNFDYLVAEGDSVRIRGSLAQFMGTAQILVDTLILSTEGEDLYDPELVNTLDEYSESEMRMLINRSHTLAPERPVLVYTEFALSTEPGASTLYTDSQWLNASGAQIAYETCPMNRDKTGPGRDYNLFFGNETNSYGKQLERMVQKVMKMGFDGIYHDDFMAEGTSYTFGTWDNHSAILHPETKAVTQTMGSIPLLIQHHAIKTMQMVRPHGTLTNHFEPPSIYAHAVCYAHR